jgi:hypothetical protein
MRADTSPPHGIDPVGFDHEGSRAHKLLAPARAVRLQGEG